MQLHNVPHIPVVAGLKLFWDRVTFSRLTQIYFIFSVLHSIIQVVFQVQAFVANAEAAHFLNDLIQQGNATDSGFAVYDGDLRICEQVPSSFNVNSCTVVWDGHTMVNTSLIGTQGYVANMSVSSSAAPSSTPAATVSASFTSVSSSIPALLSFSSPAASSSSNSSSSTVISSAASTALTSKFSSVVVESFSAVSAATERAAHTVTVTVSPSATLSPTSSTSEFSSTVAVSFTTVLVATERAAHTVTVTASVFDDDDDNDESDDDDDLIHIVSIHKRDPVLAETKVRLALNGTARVNLGGLNGLHDVDLPRKCLYALNWPADSVGNTKREDIAFIAFQIWLLGMSLVALLNESIPHIVASLLTHILATAWGAFQIYNTEVFHNNFTHLTTLGACGINLLPDYWKSRSNAEIPSLALNAFGLLVSGFLSWRLMKTFGWQTFKRVGASRTINRVYTMVLMFSIAIQLALFFVGASAALWIDQVYNGNIGRLTMQPKVFLGIMITVLVLLIPWLSSGWISVRKEYRKTMLAFLAIAFLVLVGWASMFIAPTFRWTYATWLFFRLMTTAAVLLIVATLILGIICRVNFGKGLSRYLNAHEELTDDAYDEKTYDSEKIAFPSNDSPVPTFSVTFGSGQEVPPPSQMRFAPRNMGPRFYSGTTFSSTSNPFDMPADGNTVRSGSPSLNRQDSRSSQMSHSSTDSAGSTSSKGSASKRWVIE